MADKHTQQTTDQITVLIQQALSLADRLELGLTAIYLEQALNAVESEIGRA